MHAFGSCVAVLDPPREGVHWKVIKALRGAPEIERVVYVSCNHVAWVEQARALCCPGDGEDSRTPGEPFRPVRERERERVGRESEVQKQMEEENSREFSGQFLERYGIGAHVRQHFFYTPFLWQVKANGVDLFPHTSHVELVVLFERGECLKRTLAAQGQTKPETQSLQP